MTELTITQQIRDREVAVGVIGLGYVGLPVACILAKTGFKVIGVDIQAERIATINVGQSPIGGEEPGITDLIAETTTSGNLHATTDYQALSQARVIIVCVDTPVDKTTHYPTYRALRAALTALGEVIGQGTLVIIESTIAPGTMSRIVIPELEQSSRRKAGIDFYVGHCPERVTPGLLLHNLKHVSRTVGGQTSEVAEAMLALYRQYVNADLDEADLLTAEIVKTGENAYRDVQIAFANELAIICERLGADVYKVRELLNKSPGRAMLLPGAGVGGHCIPKDPWLLIANVGEQYQAQLIPAARAVNGRMPYHIVELLESALAEHQISLNGARIAVLGYAFREDTDDDRDSPTLYFVEELTRRGAIPVIHDPHIPAYRGALEEVLRDAQAVVLMVAHSAYRALDLDHIYHELACPVCVDGRHVVDATKAKAIGFTYRGVGQSQ